MSTVTSDRLQDLVTNALERMAFVFTEESDVTAGEVMALARSHAIIELRGVVSHVVTVSATEGIVQEIASGMMGCEPDEIDVDDHGSATVAELANVFGGELVMQLSCDQEGLMIGLPSDLEDEDAGRMVDRAAVQGLIVVSGSEAGHLVVTVTSDA